MIAKSYVISQSKIRNTCLKITCSPPLGTLLAHLISRQSRPKNDVPPRKERMTTLDLRLPYPVSAGLVHLNLELRSRCRTTPP
jgi:hypothetical protein